MCILSCKNLDCYKQRFSSIICRYGSACKIKMEFRIIMKIRVCLPKDMINAQVYTLASKVDFSSPFPMLP